MESVSSGPRVAQIIRIGLSDSTRFKEGIIIIIIICFFNIHTRPKRKTSVLLTTYNNDSLSVRKYSLPFPVQITLEIPLKTEIHIEEAVENITKAIQHATWQATPNRNERNSKEECPIIVKQKVAEKRKARKRWQLTRASHDKDTTN
jgi:hypothetical protein